MFIYDTLYKTFTSKTITLKVKSSNTIINVKSKIKDNWINVFQIPMVWQHRKQNSIKGRLEYYLLAQEWKWIRFEKIYSMEQGSLPQIHLVIIL